jgi:hypothetical protein
MEERWAALLLTKKAPYKESSHCCSHIQHGEGDRSVESLEVKVPEGWAFRSDPYRGASNLAGCSKSESVKPRNRPPARNGLRECRECRAGGHSAKANVGIEVLDIDVKLPGVGEDGMSGRSVQRKLGTTRGSPRRSRTAKALRISRHAVKSRCARKWGGWGRLSEDGPGKNNPDPSEGLWGGGVVTHHGSALSSPRPDTVRDYRSDHEVHEGQNKPVVGQRMPGAGLS